MTWQLNELVYSGNNQARVKNYYPDTGLIVIYDIYGDFQAGMTIVGGETGTTLTLTEFNITLDYDLRYEPDEWEQALADAIYDGDGNIVALEEHFTGLLSQDYQFKYYVVEG
jgi:glycosyltransferase involved in cell wall biosynthesis